jgi:ABC-2 type transport system permease protein
MSQLPSKTPPIARPPTVGRTVADELKWGLGKFVQYLLGLWLLAVAVCLAWAGSALADEILRDFSATAADRYVEVAFASWLGGYVGSFVKLLAFAGALTAAWAVVVELTIASAAGRRRFRWRGVAAIWAVLGAQALITELLRQFAGLPVVGVQELMPLGVSVVIALLAAVAHLLSRSKVVPLAWREFKALLLNPMGYGLLAVMLLVMAKVVADALGAMRELDPYSENALAPLRLIFNHWGIPIVFLLLGPLATMGLISEERGRGTLEGLMTLPAREWHIVAGKFLGCFAAVGLLWTTVLFYVAFLGLFGSLDLGQVFTSFLVVYLLLMMLVAAGLFCSSLCRSQLAAAVLSVVLVAGMMWASELPSFFGASAGQPAAFVGSGLDVGALSYFDGQTHLTWAARGTIDSRTLAYLLSMTVLFLFLSVHALKAVRTGGMDLRRYGRLVARIAVVVTWILLTAAVLVLGVWQMALLLDLDPAPANRELLLLGLVLLMVGHLAAFFVGAPRLLTARSRPLVIGLAGFALLLCASVALGLLVWQRVLSLPWGLSLGAAALVASSALVFVVPGEPEGRRIRWTANIVTGALAIVAAAIGFNFLGYWYHSHVDLSHGAAFSLPAEARQVFNEKVPRGETVEVISLVSYKPPTVGEVLDPLDAQGNFRYEVLKLHLDTLDKAINKPGNIKFVSRFLQPDTPEYEEHRNEYPIFEEQDLILLYRGRSLVIPDSRLFALDYNEEAIQKLIDEQKRLQKLRKIPREYEIESLAEIKRRYPIERLPAQFQTIRPRVDEHKRVVIEKRVIEGAISLVTNTLVKVYVATGNGESPFLRRDFRSQDRTSLGAAAELRQEGLQVDALAAGRPVPQDCDVLVIAGPTKQFTAEQVRPIEAYFDRGGAVVLMLDPAPGESDKDPAEPFAGLLKKVGIETEPFPTYTFFNMPGSPEEVRARLMMMARSNPMMIRQLAQQVRQEVFTDMWLGHHVAAIKQRKPRAAEKQLRPYNTHPITRPLWDELMGLVPQALAASDPRQSAQVQTLANSHGLSFEGVRYVAPVAADPQKPGEYRITPLLWVPGQVVQPPPTGPDQRPPPGMTVWAEDPSTAAGMMPLPLPDPGERRGPYPFAVIAEKLTAAPELPEGAADVERFKPRTLDPDGGKLLVIGDSDFVSDPRGMRFLRPCLVAGANRKLWTRMIAYLAAGKKKPIEVTAKDLKPFNPKKKQLEKAPIGLLAVLLVTVSVLLGTMVWLIRRRA